MEKRLIYIISLITILLTGCSNNQIDSESVIESSSPASSSSVTEVKEPHEKVAKMAYDYKLNEENFLVQPLTSESKEDVILLTFDDAPHPAGDIIKIANSLDKLDVSAIFFVNGMYLEGDENVQNREIIKDLAERGFEIGNHTHTHAHLPEFEEDFQRQEIIKTNDIVEEITGKRPRFFRPPHGSMTAEAMQVIKEENMMWMNWTFGYDWEEQYITDPAALADITVNNSMLMPGANILMHDRTWTAEAVPAIVKGLEEKGYTIVDPKTIQTVVEDE